MTWQFRWRARVRIGAGLIAGAGMLGVGGCGDSFSNDCATTRSCTPVAAGGEGGGAGTNGSVGGSAMGGEDMSGRDDQGGAISDGGEPAGPCESSADCSNGDAADGEEQCKAGVCVAGDAPPRVVSITPADGDDEVDPEATVSIVFSEPVDPDTITPETVKVYAGDTEVAGTLKLSTAHDQLRFAAADALHLWGTYRVEITRAVKDAAGVPMLEDFASRFRVRDGAWSVTTLAEADALELPNTLPVASGGALLTTWLLTEGSTCGASGAWVLRAQSKLSDIFSTALTSDCSHISSSIAPDGSAAVIWAAGGRLWTQSFIDPAWSVMVGAAPGYGGTGLSGAQVFAHDSEHITVDLDVDASGSPIREFLRGPARGDWPGHALDLQSYIEQLGSRIEAVFDTDGNGLAVWSYTDGVYVLAYDARAKSWEADATILPGTEGTNVQRSVPSIATTPDGETLVAWVEGPTNSQVLKCSRFDAENGWQDAPTNVSTGLGGEPLFEAPALVFDGETFVTAWTAATGGKLTTYTARYDMKTAKWSQREPHVSELGESSVLMPRLAADAQSNLMLVWAVGDDPVTLVYQRYDAEAAEWGSVEAIPDGSFSDAVFATEGKLPFGFASNGLGGVLFRNDENDGSQTLKLASFF